MIEGDVALDLAPEPVDADIAMDRERRRRRGPAKEFSTVITLLMVTNNHGAWGEYFDDSADVDENPYVGDAFVVALVAYKFVQTPESVDSELAEAAMKITNG